VEKQGKKDRMIIQAIIQAKIRRQYMKNSRLKIIQETAKNPGLSTICMNTIGRSLYSG